jgi:predicted RND superfamily exporter protein
MNLVVVPPEGSFRTADSILLMDRLEKQLLDIDGITRVRSITGVLAELNSLLHGRKPEYAALPENPVSLEALVRLLDGVLPGERRNWLDDNYTHARFLVEISDFSSRNIERIIKQSEQAVAGIFPAGTSAQFSGSTYLVALMNQYITHGLVRSVATALLIISIIMVMVFRSFRWGIIAMIPNVFPVFIAGAVLGFAGIPLEFVTMTVAPIILGLAVDDTIHFMSYLKEDMAQSGDYELSLQRSFNSVGTAITETTLILCVTFLVFLVSRINSIRYMGIIASAGMAAAYFADLLVTPVLLRFLLRRKDMKSGNQLN